MRLILSRHGETSWNEARRYQGWEDPPLSRLGRATAVRLGGRLGALLGGRSEPEGFTLWASDLRRAEETARAATGRTPRLDRRLRELDFGLFAGRTYDQNVARFGAAFTDWIACRGSTAPPGGESADALLDRACAWLGDVRSATPAGGTVVAVTHGGVIRLLVEHLTGATCWPGPGDVTVLRTAGAGMAVSMGSPPTALPRSREGHWTLDRFPEVAR